MEGGVCRIDRVVLSPPLPLVPYRAHEGLVPVPHARARVDEHDHCPQQVLLLTLLPTTSAAAPAAAAAAAAA